MKKWLVIVLAMVMAISLAACGGASDLINRAISGGEEEKNLENYVKNENPAEMHVLEESVRGTPMTVDVRENTIYCVYTYDETYNTEEIGLLADYFDTHRSDLADDFNALASTLERNSGVKYVFINLRYQDASGTEIYTYKFE